MKRFSVTVQTLIKKIRDLPPDKVAQVEGFVDFLRLRHGEERLRVDTTRLSETAFAAVWDNPEDAVYDDL